MRRCAQYTSKMRRCAQRILTFFNELKVKLYARDTYLVDRQRFEKGEGQQNGNKIIIVFIRICMQST